MKTKTEIRKKIKRSYMNASATLEFYARRVGDDSGDMDVLIIDLLTDLRHYCEKHGLNFAHLGANAMMHARAEEADGV